MHREKSKNSVVGCGGDFFHPWKCCCGATSIISDRELSDTAFIRSVRSHAFDLRIPNRQWPDALSNFLRDYHGDIVDALGRIVELDMSHLESPEGQETDEAPYARWYQDFCNTPCPPNVTPFVRKEAWERVRIIATLLRATYPVRAATWGNIPANDNRPPKSSI